jgi:uncharacterized protein YndB with AHSA1/START domain
MLNTDASAAFRLQVRRRLEGPPEAVFRAFTDPAQVRAWLAGGGRVMLTPRVGGELYVEVIYQDQSYPHYGRYLRVEPVELLEFTWTSRSTLGSASIVTVALAPSGTGTYLRLTHTGLPDKAMQRDYRAGWEEAIENLYRAINALPAAG